MDRIKKFISSFAFVIMLFLMCNINTFATEKITNVTDENSLRAAINNHQSEITIMDNIDLSTGIEIDETVTINLNGFTISASNDTIGDGIFHVVPNGNLTIEGIGTIDASTDKNKYRMAIWVDGGKCTINGGYYTNANVAGLEDHYDLIYVKNGGTLIINNGNFKCLTPKWTLNKHDTTENNITINTGCFYKFNPAISETEPNSPVSFIKDTDCQFKVNDDYLVSYEHTWVEQEEKKASCSTDGVNKHYKCFNCGKLALTDENPTTGFITIESITISGGHEIKHIPESAGFYPKEGNIEYWECTRCNNYFSDAEGKNIITEKDSVIIPYVAFNVDKNKGYISLEAAIADSNENESIEILKDIETDSIITISKSIKLDGKNKKIISSATRAINISGVLNVTIENLTIEASGERAINIIQNSKTINLNNITATAKNYAVNVASSAPDTNVEIYNCVLTGLNVVNIAGSQAHISINNTVLNCEDTNKNENYSALVLNKDATNGKILFVNGTINLKDDSVKATCGSENGSILINGSDSEVEIDVASVEYGNYYYGFTTVNKAIQKTNENLTVKLIRNTKETNTIIIDKNINFDLNGKTFSGSFELTAHGKLNSSAGLTVTTNIKNKKVEFISEDGINGSYVIVDCTHNNTKTIPAVNATCSKTGLTKGKECADCGLIIEEQKTIDKKDHSFGSWKTTQNATCGTKGTKKHTCEKCGATETKSIDITGKHTYASNGYCSVCNAYDASKVVISPTPTIKPTTMPSNTIKPIATPEAPEKEESAKPEEVLAITKEKVVIEENTAIINKEAITSILEKTTDDILLLPISKTTENAVFETKIDTEAFKDIADKVEELVIEFTDATVKFDTEAINAILKNAKGDKIEIKAIKIETNTLTETQKSSLEDKETSIIISVQVFSNEEYIGDFKNGKATIVMPFIPEENTKIEDYSVYHLAEDGSLEKIKTEYFNGCISFETPHFSDFAIIYEESKDTEAIEIISKIENETTANHNKIFIIIPIIVIILSAFCFTVIKIKNKK